MVFYSQRTVFIWSFLVIAVTQQMKPRLCYVNMTDEILLKLKVRSAAFLSSNPYFRKQVLGRLPDYYYNPPTLAPKTFSRETPRCQHGPATFPHEGHNITDLLPMMCYTIPGICNGVYITSSWVLAPSHCLTLTHDQGFYIRSLGHFTDLKDHVYQHPQYGVDKRYDVALFKVSQPNKDSLPACRPDPWTDVPSPKTTCVVTRFVTVPHAAKKELNSTTDAYELRHVFVTVRYHDETYLYVRDHQRGKPHGVLFCRNNEEFSLVGTVTNNVRIPHYLAFLRISKHTRWIQHIISSKYTVVTHVDYFQKPMPENSHR